MKNFQKWPQMGTRPPPRKKQSMGLKSQRAITPDWNISRFYDSYLNLAIFSGEKAIYMDHIKKPAKNENN